MDPRDDQHRFDPRRKETVSAEAASAFLRGLLTCDELLELPASEQPKPAAPPQYWWQRD